MRILQHNTFGEEGMRTLTGGGRRERRERVKDLEEEKRHVWKF